MSRRVCVIDLPGLSRSLVDAIPSDSALGRWVARQQIRALRPTWPAVTCSVQATLTTGTPPSQHGIVANGLATFRSAEDQRLIDASNFASYRREVSFWEQSNQFLQAKRFWQDETGRSRYRTAMLFFQNSMPGFVEPKLPAADIVITPKPEHGGDGKITSLCWSDPSDLVPRLFSTLGPFPLMKYWGPMAGIESSQWIARAAVVVWSELTPQLQLVYVPHLDYDLQRFGPSSPQAIKAVRDVAAAVEPLVEAVLREDQAELVLLSEYAMTDVKRAIQPNRVLANAGLLVTRDTPDGKLIDYAESAAFAMCDHQIAHVCAKDSAAAAAVGELLGNQPDVEVLPRAQTLPHRRAGDLTLQASADAWFDYRWWSDASSAPTFAKDVDIHRKPGYDPLELFFEPAIKGVSQDPARVRGSHGRIAVANAADHPVLIGSLGQAPEAIQTTAVAGLLERMLT